MGWYREVKGAMEGCGRVDTFEDAMLPMMAPFLKSPQGRGWTSVRLCESIADTVARMDEVLARLKLQGKYPVHYAACLNTYTQDKPHPQWFKWIASVLHAPDRAYAGGLPLCAKFMWLFNEALMNLPEKFIHRGECWRGIPYAFDHPTQHFFSGKRFVFFDFKSFSRDEETADRFCEREQSSLQDNWFVDLRDRRSTKFAMHRGCRAYKIDAFSEYEQQEVVFPLLSVFKVQSTQEHQHQHQHLLDFQRGLDLVNFEHMAPLPRLPEKADEVQRLADKHLDDFQALIYFLRNGFSEIQPIQEEALASARLVHQAYHAMVLSVEEQVTGQKVIVLAGATGAGKSALCNWLIGNKLELVAPTRGDRPHTLKVNQASPNEFAVGTSRTKSTTFLPKAVQIGDGVVLVDFPGFFDTTNDEMQIAIDLAFQKVIRLAGQVHVLALADVNSGGSLQGDGLRRQLVKLKRHLPLQRGRAPFHLGITKAGWRIQGVQAHNLLKVCKDVLESEFPELPEGHIVNVNADWLFPELLGGRDEEASDEEDDAFHSCDEAEVRPQDVVERLLHSVGIESHGGCDCLDQMQVETFGKQFREFGFLDNIHAKLSEIGAMPAELDEFLFGEVEDVEKCAGGAASSEGAQEASQEVDQPAPPAQPALEAQPAQLTGLSALSALKDMQDHVAQINRRVGMIRSATRALTSEKPAKLLVQQVCEQVKGGEGVAWLCGEESVSFARLRKEMLAADKKYSQLHQRENLGSFSTIGLSIREAKDKKWLNEADANQLEETFREVQEALDQKALEQGFANAEAQCGEYVPVSTRSILVGAGAGVAAGAGWWGAGMGVVAGVASFTPVIGVGVVVGVGVFAMAHTWSGEKPYAHSKKLKEVLCAAMEALQQAYQASCEHSHALQAYETEIERSLRRA
jgi:hypothetical protein